MEKTTKNNSNGTVKQESSLGTWIIIAIIAAVIWHFTLGNTSIVGSWETIRSTSQDGTTYESESYGDTAMLSFHKDGNGVLMIEDEQFPFTYSYDDHELMVYSDNGIDYINCDIHGKKMTMKSDGSELELKRR